MSAHDLAGAASPALAEEPGRGRPRPRPGADLTAEQVAVIASRPTLTFDEACVYTNQSRETLRKRVRSGELVARRWGRKLIFKRSDLDAFLDNLPSAQGAA